MKYFLFTLLFCYSFLVQGQQWVRVNDGNIEDIGMTDTFYSPSMDSTYTNYRSQSLSLFLADGWKNVYKPILKDNEEHGGLYYDTEKDAVYRSVVDSRTLLSLDSLQQLKIEDLDRAVDDLFSEITTYVLYYWASGTQPPQSHKDEIADIITKRNNIEAAIRAIQTKEAVINYEIPHAQIEDKRRKLKLIRRSL